jgi:hypothetical protein
MSCANCDTQRLLRDVFVWAYERSAQRYVAVRQSLGEPDKFRLKFRNELTEVVGEIVRRGLSPTVEEVTKAASERVPPEHLDDFVRMTIRELENLHEGNFARFRLRPDTAGSAKAETSGPEALNRVTRLWKEARSSSLLSRIAGVCG